MASDGIGEAWVTIVTEEERRAQMPPGPAAGCDFGFLPAMGRLLAAHPGIGPLFGALFRQIMFEPVLAQHPCNIQALRSLFEVRMSFSVKQTILWQ